MAVASPVAGEAAGDAGAPLGRPGPDTRPGRFEQGARRGRQGRRGRRKRRRLDAQLGQVVRVHRGYRPVPWWVRVWVVVGAVPVAAAVCLAAGKWWPAPVVAAVAIAGVNAYGWLRPVRGVRAERAHAGGLVLVGPGGAERVLPWGAVEATEHSPGRRGVCERARIWLVGVDEPVDLVHVRRLEGAGRELDERRSPAFRAALHERLRTDGSVRFASGRLTVRAGGLVHRSPTPGGGGVHRGGATRTEVAPGTRNHGTGRIRRSGRLHQESWIIELTRPIVSLLFQPPSQAPLTQEGRPSCVTP